MTSRLQTSGGKVMMFRESAWSIVIAVVIPALANTTQLLVRNQTE